MFDNTYQAILADTEESRNIHFKLRYQVYCLEKGYEPAGKFEDGLEKDEYDDNSVHFLIQERASGRWLGTARLVIAEPKKLPISELTDIEESKLTSENHKVAELSRLSILRNFRLNHQNSKVQERYQEPEIILGIIRAAKTYCRETGIKNCLFLCRRSIRRILGKVGINMDLVGPPCEHKGMRYPYLTKFDDFKRIPEVSAKIARMFSQQTAYVRYSELDDWELPQAA